MKNFKLEIDDRVKYVFAEYPPAYRKKLRQLRQLIIETAKELSEVECLIETLKWGEPSYLTKQKGLGATVRIHWLKTTPDRFGIYFNCKTDLISQFKAKFPKQVRYDGKRAILFSLADNLPASELKECIGIALRYHLRK